MLLTIKNTLLYMVFSHLFVNTGMVFLAFGRCRKKEFLENWAVTYLVVILLGGMLQWLVGRGLTPAGLVPAAAGISGVYLILAYLRERKNFSNHIFEAQMKKRERAIAQGILGQRKSTARSLYRTGRLHFERGKGKAAF